MVALVYSPTTVSDPNQSTKTTQPPVMRPLNGGTGNGFQDFMQQLAQWSGGGQFGSQLQSWLGQMPNQSAGQTLDQYRQTVMDWRHAMPTLSGGGTTMQPAPGYGQQGAQTGGGFNAPPSQGDQQFYQSHGFYPGG